MRVTRKSALAGIISVLLAGIAMAGLGEVIDFAGPSTVVAGSNISATVTVNEVPMSVTFTSSPAGFVSYTTTVTSTTQSVSIPTSSSGSGSYTITAAPTGGGPGISSGIAAQPSSISNQ